MRLTASQLVLVTIIAIIGLGVFIPFSLIFSTSFYVVNEGKVVLTTEAFEQVVNDPRMIGTMLDTLTFSVLSTLFSVPIGVSLAWLIGRTNIPFAKWLEPINLVPIFLDPFIYAVAWGFVASPKAGLLNNLSSAVLGVSLFNIYSWPGLIIANGLFGVPYIFLFSVGAFRAVDVSLEETARVCGSNPLTTFVRVTAPVVLPAIVSGMLFRFVVDLGSFPFPYIIGSRIGVYVMSVRIYSLFISNNYALAAALGSITVALMALAVTIRWKTVGFRPYVTIGKGFGESPLDLGRWRYAALFFNLCYIGIAVVLPYSFLGTASFQEFWSGVPRLDLLTLGNYLSIFNIAIVKTSVINGIFVALAGATLGMITVTIWAYVQERFAPGGAKVLMQFVSYVPIVIPQIMWGIGYLWASVRTPLYGSIWNIIVALVLAQVPLGVTFTVPTIGQISTELEESARICGASLLQSFRRIVLPLVKPAFVAGWTLLFIIFLRDLAIVLPVYTMTTVTMPVVAFNLWQEGHTGVIAAMGILMFAIILSVMIIVRKIFGVGITQLAK
jgi:iron(III) transport system permease protein